MQVTGHYCWDLLRIVAYNWSEFDDKPKLSVDFRCSMCRRHYEAVIIEPAAEQLELTVRLEREAAIVNVQAVDGRIRLLENKIAPPRFTFFIPDVNRIEEAPRDAKQKEM